MGTESPREGTAEGVLIRALSKKFPPVPRFGVDGEPPPQRVEGQPYRIDTWENSLVLPNVSPVDGIILKLLGVFEPTQSWHRFAQWKEATVTPFWERVDKYGEIIRIAHGDERDFTVETEEGLAIEASTKLAASVGLSVDTWSVKLQTTLNREFGYAVTVSRNEKTANTLRFGNRDEEKRDRLIALWRPGIAVRVLTLDDICVREPQRNEVKEKVLEMVRSIGQVATEAAYYFSGLEHSDYFKRREGG